MPGEIFTQHVHSGPCARGKKCNLDRGLTAKWDYGSKGDHRDCALCDTVLCGGNLVKIQQALDALLQVALEQSRKEEGEKKMGVDECAVAVLSLSAADVTLFQSKLMGKLLHVKQPMN